MSVKRNILLMVGGPTLAHFLEIIMYPLKPLDFKMFAVAQWNPVL